MSGSLFLQIATQLSLALILVGMAVAFVRIAVGPSLADRVVALDMMTVTIISFCGVYAVFMDEPALLDVAIVLALVGFLATVALARYAERRFELENGGKEEDSPSSKPETGDAP